jgi:hypothetical protein
MKQFTMLVTPDGQWVLPDTPEFFAALGDPDPDYDAIAFAVKNLGFIRFQVIEQSIVEIELHPRNVEFAALLAVQQQLLSSQVYLFRIKYFDGGWKSEIASSAEFTISRLSEICAPQFTPASHDRFLVEPQDFAALLEDEGNQMRPMAQKWRVSFGHFDPSVITLAMHNQLLSLTAIIGIQPRERDPIFRFLGEGHRWVGTNYRINGIGEKVENLPDKDYGNWAAEFYRSVASSGQPRYDVVTASMQYEDESGKPRRTVRYERLLLPWKTPSAEIFVSSCARRLNGTSRSDFDASAVKNLSRSSQTS